MNELRTKKKCCTYTYRTTYGIRRSLLYFSSPPTLSSGYNPNTVEKQAGQRSGGAMLIII